MRGNRVCTAFVCCFVMGPSCSLKAEDSLQAVPFPAVRLTGGMWHERQETNRRVTLPFALDQCESSKRLLNFDLAAETMRRRAAGEKDFQHKPPTQYPFDDSDVFKVLEAAAYALQLKPDKALEQRVENIIGRIAAAQEPDGYLYTWRTMHPDNPAHPWIDEERWKKDPGLSHELYNLGHLYEAGVAHEQATGSRALLDVCLRSAELLQRDFGDGEPRIAPGHQVIEMGLVKLHQRTGDPRWLDLAEFFLSTRGTGSEYSQDHQPVADQRKAVGHAVRANYMYSGMADVAALRGDGRYFEALHALWNNVAGTKLHITGGCGARAAGEAYGDDYELPHRCYNETCAAISFLFWNHRMFLATGEGKYMDVFERTLYNGFLSGVSLSGDRFFYPNPLEHDGKEANNHGHAGRAPWFGCACCPPNTLRMIASLGGYVAAVKGDTLYVNLYSPGEIRTELAGGEVRLRQTTDYPWEGRIRLDLEMAAPRDFTLALRLPGWALGKPLPTDLYHYLDDQPSGYSVSIQGKPVRAVEDLGYLRLTRRWNPGDRIELDFPMPVRRVLGNERIAATRGQVALERGPVVYCLEGVDNDGRVFDFFLPDDAPVTARRREDLFGGVVALHTPAAQRVRRGEGADERITEAAEMTAIPYALWNNRGLAPMAVWIAREAEGARPVPAPTLASTAAVRVSFARGGMDPGRVQDQQMPRNATDGFAPNFDFWPHKGGREWIEYEFTREARVAAVTVAWFDDTGTGECRLPKSWKLLYRAEDGSWREVEAVDAYAARVREPVRLAFTAVTTRAMRLEIEQEDGFSAGLYEWEVHPAE